MANQNNEEGWEDIGAAPVAPRSEPLQAGWETVDESPMGKDIRVRRERLARGLPEEPPTMTGAVLEHAPRMAAEIVGGTVGAAGGAVGGAMAGGPPGAIAGGVVGSGAGTAGASLLFDKARNFLIEKGVLRDQKPRSKEEIIDTALDAGLLTSAGGAALVPMARLYQRAKAAAFGVTPEARRLGDQARAEGVNLGIVDVAEGSIPSGVESIVGKFPWIGGPFRKASERKMREIEEAGESVLYRIGIADAPEEIGNEIYKGAKEAYKTFRAESKKRFGTADRLAAQNNSQVPTDGLKEAAETFVKEYEKNLPRQLVKQEDGTFKEVAIRAGEDPDLLPYARALRDMPPTQTVEQYKTIMRELKRLIASAKNDNYDFRDAVLLEDARRADFLRQSDPDARSAYESANKWFSENTKKFETPTAKKLARADKRLFKPGAEDPGTINPDELFDVALSKKSPQAIMDLRDIVGPDILQKATATRVSEAFEKSFVQEAIRGGKSQPVFSGENFLKALNLERGDRGRAYQTLQTALRLSGSKVTADDIIKFANVAEAGLGRGNPSWSQFVGRRVALGGATSGLAALPIAGAMTGASGATTAFAGPGIPILFRWFASSLSNPRTLADLTAMLSPKTSDRFAAAAVRRLIKAGVITPMAPTSGVSDKPNMWSPEEDAQTSE